MNESKIAVRYAKALFLLALEKGRLENVRNDLELISKTAGDVIEFNLYMKSPIVKPSKKINLISQVFKGKIDDISLQFISLLIQNKREDRLEDIIRRFVQVYRDYKGIKSASLTTAIPIDDQVKRKLKDLLTSVYKTEVELETKENSAIIGGFILKVQDQQYDASIASGLKKMKAALLNGN